MHFISDEWKRQGNIPLFSGLVYCTTFWVHRSKSLWVLVPTKSSTSHWNAGSNEPVDIKAMLSREQVLNRREYKDLLSSSWAPALTQDELLTALAKRVLSSLGPRWTEVDRALYAFEKQSSGLWKKVIHLWITFNTWLEENKWLFSLFTLKTNLRSEDTMISTKRCWEGKMG